MTRACDDVLLNVCIPQATCPYDLAYTHTLSLPSSPLPPSPSLPPSLVLLFSCSIWLFRFHKSMCCVYFTCTWSFRTRYRYPPLHFFCLRASLYLTCNRLWDQRQSLLPLFLAVWSFFARHPSTLAPFASAPFYPLEL